MKVNVWFKPRRFIPNTGNYGIGEAHGPRDSYESDQDYVLNNLKICVKHLNELQKEVFIAHQEIAYQKDENK